MWQRFWSGSEARGRERGEATGLTVQALFRGLLIDERILRHRPGARRGERYRIGAVSTASAPAPLPLLGLSFLRLLEDTPGGFRLRVTPTMDGTITTGGGAVAPLRAWVERVGDAFLFPPGAEARLTCGEMEYRIGWADPVPAVRGALFRPDWREQRYTVATGIALLLGLLVLSFIPPDSGALSLPALGRHTRLIDFRLIPLAAQPLSPRRDPGGQVNPGGGGAANSDPAPAPAAAPARVGQRRAAASPAGQTALEREQEIRRSGLLGLFRPQSSPQLAWLLERGTALGREGEELLRDLRGSAIGDAYAYAGLAPIGTGAAGAGGEPTVGIGRLETIGVGPGGRPGGDYGGPVGRLGERRPRPLEVVTGAPVVRGALDREIIRRVVRRHINEIRYCYERELLRGPTLSGRLAIRFTIAPTGQIAAAVLDSSSLGNARVELCTMEAVRRWTFPQPQGGGIVVATYPFTFVPAGHSR